MNIQKLIHPVKCSKGAISPSAKLFNRVKTKVREIPDWPKLGISFKDITPLLQDKELFPKVIDELCKPYLTKKTKVPRSGTRAQHQRETFGAVVDKIVGIDARGFLLASAMAYKLKTGIAIIRKQGKLPSKTISKQYALEYGSNTIEMHQDSILPGEKVLLVDDVLATGGTMKAAIDLVKELRGKIVGIEFLIELIYLNGRKILKGQKIRSLVRYNSAGKTKPQKKLAEIGIIGGSGFYEFFKNNVPMAKSSRISRWNRGSSTESGLDKVGTKEIEIETEYGKPSDKITIGKVFGKKVAFLPRHGKNHQIPPHKINYRANISALKQIGVEKIIAPAAVGSLRKNIKPGDFVICDQFIDRTKKRDDTFFDGPKVAHIEMAYPYCPELRKVAISQGKKLKLKVHPEGTVAVIEGPKFSTMAESIAFSKMGCDVINMTQYPEVVLAQELGMCYVNISLVTDYDVGIYSKEKIAPVSIEQVLANFKANIDKLKVLISEIIKNIPQKTSCDCRKKAERALLR